MFTCTEAGENALKLLKSVHSTQNTQNVNGIDQVKLELLYPKENQQKY